VGQSDNKLGPANSPCQCDNSYTASIPPHMVNERAEEKYRG
jgi:hypothetical protein